MERANGPRWWHNLIPVGTAAFFVFLYLVLRFGFDLPLSVATPIAILGGLGLGFTLIRMKFRKELTMFQLIVALVAFMFYLFFLLVVQLPWGIAALLAFLCAASLGLVYLRIK